MYCLLLDSRPISMTKVESKIIKHYEVLCLLFILLQNLNVYHSCTEP